MMPEEVTPKDIRQIYENKEKEIITNIVLSSIDRINAILKRDSTEIVKEGWLKTSAKKLDWSAPSTRWSSIVDHLAEFYTSWTVERKWSNGEYIIYFTPKIEISREVKIDMSLIKNKKEVVPDDEQVDNRADILDL